MDISVITSEGELLSVALALGAAEVGGPLTAKERALIRAGQATDSPSPATIAAATSEILDGGDPLGRAFLNLRDAATRRDVGAIYTPPALVEPMVEWALKQHPERVVDAGSGSGRFVFRVLSQRPDIKAIAIDLDPMATLMTRATCAVIRPSDLRVRQMDYTKLRLPRISGKTAFIGNPPYVRHHQLTSGAKDWAQMAAAELGHKISGLAGLHSHFFLATAAAGRAGDVGCFVTSAEWLDVNYGSIIRDLLLGRLGGQSLHVVEPSAFPFEGTQTTAVVSTFSLGSIPSAVRVQEVTSLDTAKDLATAGQPINRQRLEETPRWTGLLRSATTARKGFIELGEICRVHRGAVTGANATWVKQHRDDMPESVLFHSVTKARELFAAGDVLRDKDHLRLVVDIPSDLDELSADARKIVERFIRAAKRAGVDKGYIASHRRAWWSVGLKAPAPILATYMARRVPAFVVNDAGARHINIAHGLYPREPMSQRELARLSEALRTGVSLGQGRVYAGGLTKFEPREMERLLVPGPDMLRSHEPISAPMDFR